MDKPYTIMTSIAQGLEEREIILYNMCTEKGLPTLGLRNKGIGIIPDASRRCLKIWLLDNYAKYIFGIISEEEMRTIQAEWNRIDRKYWYNGEWTWYNTDITLLNMRGTSYLSIL